MEGIVITTVFFLTVIAIWGTYLVTRHRERTMIIEKGLGAEEVRALYATGMQRATPLASLKWGFVLIGAGVGTLIAIWLRDVYGYNEGVYPGMIALVGGLGLVVFYLVAAKKKPA